MMYQILLTLGLFLLINSSAISQSFIKRNTQGFSISAGLGTVSYYGDLNDPSDFFDFSTYAALGVKYKFHKRLNFRADLSYLRISGNDKENDLPRSLSFQTDMIELSLLGVANILNSTVTYSKTAGFNAHAILGVGLTFFNPKGEYSDGSYIALRPLTTEGVSYSQFAFVIPFGFGISFALTNDITLGIEGIYRLTLSDYLDDVSTVYPDSSIFVGDPVALFMYDKRTVNKGIPGYIRGNPDDKDGYLSLAFKIEYNLPNNVYANSRRGKFKRRK